ncbi:hypothetical protein DL89DRAFT_267248 [Linderina pennispora]|uniref:Uncharacterized protein n=1 Tax=Linderina pennispora TaxID=61395 RepID=A0A1Y1W918_9FUNG|nr:uncharacterized protein DL89DRAFT_267248 [Linderina pennispora]ORX70019.1 hypothetical protein DL89DRAFT_267248 [Linderina pennispora]
MSKPAATAQPADTPSAICEQKLSSAYELFNSIDQLVENAYDAHASVYKAFGDLAGVKSIRKDGSVSEAATTDIKGTLAALRTMLTTISQHADALTRLERKPRERTLSPELQKVLDEYAPYVRLMTEAQNVRALSDRISSPVRELATSAMRLQEGEFGDGVTADQLKEQIEQLQEAHPGLTFRVTPVVDRMSSLVVSIPTVAQMTLSMKLIDGSACELQVISIQVCGCDELGPGSKFNVFLRIAHDANIIWFSIAAFSIELRLARLVLWFSLFKDLFSATCCVCSRHLQMDPRTSQYLPPIWRGVDIKTDEPSKAYHYACVENS